MEKKRFLKYFPVGLLVTAAAAVGITGATLLHNMSLENPIKTPPVKAEIEETVDESSTKQAKFKNIGEADVFLRVAYGESWIYKNGDKTEILPNVAGLVDPDGSTTEEAVADLQPNRDDWVYGNDGWWYYKHILESGAETENFTERVDFRCFGSNKEDSGLFKDKRYNDENAEYQLHFTVEVVQASDEVEVSKDAVKQLFKKSITLKTRDGELIPLKQLDETDTREFWNWPEDVTKYSAVIEWGDSDPDTQSAQP